MYWWLLPVCSAISTWITFRVLRFFLFHPVSPVKAGNMKIQGYVPQHLDTWIDQLTEKIVQAVVTDNRLSQYITAPSTLQPMMPFIEGHIDEFLRHKLGKAMPVVSMFVGDKTISQMKSVFMNELETLLPAVINRFLEQSLQPEKLRPLILQELSKLVSDQGFAVLKKQLNRQLSKIAWVATAIAFCCGLILSLLVYCFNII